MGKAAFLRFLRRRSLAEPEHLLDNATALLRASFVLGSARVPCPELPAPGAVSAARAPSAGSREGSIRWHCSLQPAQLQSGVSVSKGPVLRLRRPGQLAFVAATSCAASGAGVNPLSSPWHECSRCLAAVRCAGVTCEGQGLGLPVPVGALAGAAVGLWAAGCC